MAWGPAAGDSVQVCATGRSSHRGGGSWNCIPLWPRRGRHERPRHRVEYQAVISPILEKHCYECHGDGFDKGKVAFDTLDTDEKILKPDLWLRVLNNTRAGLMPAEKKPRLSAAEQAKLERWIKYGVFKIDPHNPDPGRVTVRRLNRVEYRNTVHDLLGVDYNTDHEFPPDDTGFGFDNIGDALTTSPMLMEKYVAAAQTIVGEAVPTAPRKPIEQVVKGMSFDGQAARVKWGKRQLVFSEPANVGASFKTDLAGSYRVKLDMRSEWQLHPGSGQGPHHLQDRRQGIPQPGIRLSRREGLRVRVHSQVAARPSTSSPSNCSPRCRPKRKKPSSTCSFNKVTIEGPLEKAHWVKTENYDRYFPRPVPDGAKQRHAYAKELLAAFAQKAYRRPLSPQDGDDTAERLANLAESLLPRTGQVVRTGRGACHGGGAVVAALPVQTRSACGPRAECAGRRGRRILACLAPLLFPVVDDAGRRAAEPGGAR